MLSEGMLLAWEVLPAGPLPLACPAALCCCRQDTIPCDMDCTQWLRLLQRQLMLPADEAQPPSNSILCLPICRGEKLPWAEEVLVSRATLEDSRQRLADLEAQVTKLSGPLPISCLPYRRVQLIVSPAHIC